MFVLKDIQKLLTILCTFIIVLKEFGIRSFQRATHTHALSIKNTFNKYALVDIKKDFTDLTIKISMNY